MFRPLGFLLACMFGLAAGCGSGSDKLAASTTTQRPTTTVASSGCAAAAASSPGRRRLPRPQRLLARGRSYTLRLLTSCGEIDIALDVGRARSTASSIAYLARRRFYDGLTFHRIAKDPSGGDFVIQGGDPLGTGAGGPGYSVVERPPRGLRYTRGTVAMAKTEIEAPGTSGSQFFIVTAEDAGLPADYALVGRVSRGGGVVSRIAALATDASERPRRPVVIRQARVVTLRTASRARDPAAPGSRARRGTHR